MTKERIKNMLKTRIEGEILAPSLLCVIVGVIFFIYDQPLYGFIMLIIAVCFYIHFRIDCNKDLDNVETERASLFLMFENTDLLVRVMDEIIDHPIYKANGTNISEHFILFGDLYENIIRLCDVTAINITKLDNVCSRIDIADRFGQKKKIKVENPKAEEIYNYLSENCKNATIGSPIEFDEDSQKLRYIKQDGILTEEYCFDWDKAKKKKKKETKKEVKQEEVVEEEETEEVEEETPKRESTSMDQKYNDLKKLKELLDSDIITQEDYDKEKAKILSD